MGHAIGNSGALADRAIRSAGWVETLERLVTEEMNKQNNGYPNRGGKTMTLPVYDVFAIVSRMAYIGTVSFVLAVTVAAPGVGAPMGPLEGNPVQTGNAAIQILPAAPREARPPSGNPLWSIPLRSLNVTRERPIFLPSRRAPMPAAPAPVVAAAPPPPPSPAEPERLQLTLLGTIIGQDSGMAVAVDANNNKAVRLRIGEDFEGWKLLSVNGREATFEKATVQTVLRLPTPEEAQASPPADTLNTTALPNTASAPASGTWRDGDGNLIAPPKRQ